MKLEIKNGTVELPALLSVQDVRKYLRIRNDEAYNLFKNNSFPSIKVAGKNYITDTALIEYLENLK
ncbi:MAG: helix-turn-helix domain-containing protein [Peptostreptococcaceae bacterium]|nr:helix-turn-helix domain-containing protein [Peptostreptococcaceae bacterium]